MTIMTTITNAFNTVKEETAELRSQLTDVATETAKATIYTAQATVSSTLLVATTTRMTTELLKDMGPQTKEDAELQVLSFIETLTDLTKGTEEDKEIVEIK